MVGYYFWSRLSRRKGSRFVLLITTLCVSLYPGLVALTNNQTMIFIFSTVAGIFQAGIDLVFFDELMKTIPPRYSPTFVSLAQSIQYLSSILAPLVGTFLAEHIGLKCCPTVQCWNSPGGFPFICQAKVVEIID